MERHEYERMRALEETHWWFRARRRIVASVVARTAPPRGPLRVLDFGCGCGGNTAWFAAQPGFEVTGVDVCEQAIAFCRARGLERLELIPPEGWAPPAGTFDLVLALDVLEHIGPDDAALAAIWGGLREGGVLVATVPAFPFLWSAHDVALHHWRRHTRASLDALAARAGLGAWTWRSHYNFVLFPAVAAIRLGRRLAGERAAPPPPWPTISSASSPSGAATRAMPATGAETAPDAHSDTTSAPPAPLNALLEAVFAAERHLVGRVPLPWGVSLIAVARKGPDGRAT